MIILYISKILGKPWAGPTYSVPKQICYQSLLDNVFWYNLVDDAHEIGTDVRREWKKLPCYHDLTDFKTKEIFKLPEPFNKPDLIVLEQGYPFAFESVRKEITKRKIPYIIVPRGELTKDAQNKKRIKKCLGNLFIRWRSFTKKALAIQYLSKNESDTSGRKWNDQSIIIPNGVVLPTNLKKEFSSSGNITLTFIGRIEVFHKGLDLLLDAFSIIKSELLEKRCRLNIYGPQKSEDVKHLNELIIKYGLDSFVFLYDGVYGDAKSNVYEQTDVFILTSRFEGQPTALLEALSFGVPCFVTKGTNMGQDVESYDAGWCAKNSVESIKNTLLLMINQASLFKKKGTNARLLATKYSWNSVAERSHKIYFDLLNEKKHK